MVDLAEKIQLSGDFQPRLLLRAFGEYHHECVATAEKKGLVVVNAVQNSSENWVRVTAFKVLARMPKLFIFKFVRAVIEMRSIQTHTINLIEKYSFSLILMPEDSPDYGAPLVMQVARQKKIPVIIFNGLGISPPEELARIYMYSEALTAGRFISDLIRRHWPKWVFSFSSRSILRIPAEKILAYWLLKTSIPRPWLYYGSEPDTVICDNEATAQFCRSKSIPTDHFKVLGSVEHDILYRYSEARIERRFEIEKDLGFSNLAPLVLISLVQEHFVYGAPDSDFKNHMDMIEFIGRTLGNAKKLNVVVSLHPSMMPDDFRFLEQWGLKISTRPVIELIPLCDIYIASGSSTIPWAIACGKPVLNYDVYRYGSIAYNEAAGIITFADKEIFLNQIQKLEQEPEYLELMTQKQAACAKKWGKIDGKASERIIQALKAL